MLEVPVDAWYVWIGLTTVSAAVLGVAVAFPTAPPPDADAAAEAVDAVAGAGNGSTVDHPVSAAAVRFAPHSVSVRTEAGLAHARLAYGPVTPVVGDDRLEDVLDGTAPGRVFDSPAALAEAASEARNPPHRWQSADRIRARTIVWGDVRVTLVGV
ncbi:hypothetical protein BRC81_13895 [Halobacteriales archaeon QS_1_68_20]|nr:MAG: hypothetical protein BRC81_13895 [Halobacteriales archaeon QS_1_68_20]